MLLCVATSTAGCHLLRLPRLGGDDEHAVVASELHTELAGLAASFAAQTTATTERITSNQKNRDVRRAAMMWRLRVIPEAYRLAFLPEADDGYLAMVILASGLREYFTTGAGRDLFGPDQDLAVAAAERLESEAYAVGSDFLTPKQMDKLRRRVDELVLQKPIHGLFVTGTIANAATQASDTRAFDFVVGFPMIPFRALTGVSDGALAVHELNVTAQRFADLLEVLPELTRWQLELLLYDTEELETVETALAAWLRVSESMDRIAHVAETLPAELTRQLETTHEDLRSILQEATGTLQEAKAAFAEADRVFASARDLAGPLNQAATSVGAAGSSWTQTFAAIQTLREPVPGDDGESRPFDIREYTETAHAYAETARTLAEATSRLQTLVEDSRSFVELATWRVIGVLAAFFLLLLAYRVAARSLLSR